MEFDESLQQYVYSCEDLIFSWDEEPKGEDINMVHIFEFEFLDEKLEKLEHFSVNG